MIYALQGIARGGSRTQVPVKNGRLRSSTISTLLLQFLHVSSLKLGDGTPDTAVQAPLQGSTRLSSSSAVWACFSALVDTILRARYSCIFPSTVYDTISKIREHDSPREHDSSATTSLLLSRTACDEARDRQVVPHFLLRCSARTLYGAFREKAALSAHGAFRETAALSASRRNLARSPQSKA